MARPICSRSLPAEGDRIRFAGFSIDRGARSTSLHASPNHSVDVTLFLIRSSSVMTLPNGLGVLRHGGALSLTQLRLATSSSARIGAALTKFATTSTRPAPLPAVQSNCYRAGTP
jgi:hypothetical protein